QVVDILLALDDRDIPVERDGFVHFVDAVQKFGVDALRVPNPATRTIRASHAKAWLVPFWVAHFLVTQNAVSIAVVVGRSKLARVAISLLLLGSFPAAVIAMPANALLVDLDAEALNAPMMRLTLR